MVLCARCNTPAYHVEQVVGPGSKIYHKQCLKCSSCGKRLDSHLLVEHDEQPWCKNCHLKLFGTRDLRHFNHPTVPAPASAPSSPAVPPSPSAPAFEQSYLKTRPPVPPKPTFTSSSSSASQSVEKRVIEPVRERSAASLAVSSPARAGLGGSRPAWRVDADLQDKCATCGKTVYHAEQVIALDRKFHRGCLRCSICNTTLPPSKVADHDGQIVCGKCHQEHFGITLKR